MAERNTEFEMANYDGGFPTHPDPEPSGRLVLTTAGKWELHYGGKGAMKRNLRTEGMAVEDGPRLSGSCVSLESILRPLGHRRSRELPALERHLHG